MNRKIVSIAFALFVFSRSLVFSGEVKRSALSIKNTSLQMESVQEAIVYLQSQVDNTLTASDKKSVLLYLANLQEQLGVYSQSSESYVRAYKVSGTTAKDMPVFSDDEIVLCIVRTYLCCGEWEKARSYLVYSLLNASDKSVASRAKLYDSWCFLCSASSSSDTDRTIDILRSYLLDDSMGIVHSQILLTLWYLTQEKSYADELQAKFPGSVECAVAKGRVQIMSVPFWYFVPKSSGAGANSSKVSSAAANSSENARKPETKSESPKKTENESASAKTQSSSSSASAMKSAKSFERQQLGLFKNYDNAKALEQKVIAAGFSAYIESEVRSSGTKYYLVYVNEDSQKTVGERLKKAGFDCYTVTVK